MAIPSLLVFGPQTTAPSEDYLAHLRTSILEDPRLRNLKAALQTLPSLWDTITGADADIKHFAGQTWLRRFSEWLSGERLFLNSKEQRLNALLTPLTVLVHIVQYFTYLDSLQAQTNHKEILQSLASQGGVQGFCTGILSAFAISTSDNEDTIGDNAFQALRLAACIGVYIDYDGEVHHPMGCLAVKWPHEGGEERFHECLKRYPDAYVSVVTGPSSVTVTAFRANLEPILNDMCAKGLVARRISLEGRFHSSEHQSLASRLISLCRCNPELQFSSAAELLAPIRSNINGQLLLKGSLNQHAITAILVDRCNWHATMTAAISQLALHDHPIIVQFGLVDCIPAFLMRDTRVSVVRLRSLPSLTSAERLVSRPSINRAITPPPIAPLVSVFPAGSIAIVGMACKFPGANSVSEFWELMTEGRSMVRQMPKDRFKLCGLRRSSEAKLKFWGNFVDDIAAFDHKFFNKSSREAASMDPQQRLLLQVTYEAIESSGYFGKLHNMPSKDIGCYVGVCASDYNDNVASHPPNAYSSLGTLRAFLSGKVSHFFGWTGPSITYDTACSSSAVAIHAACKAIQTGECTRAVAGGVSLYTSPNFYQNLAAASFLSPTGPTKPFDASGDGYCRGEGVGMVVLQKLSDAVASGDHIMGVIAATAVNQNENSSSITVPHSPSQVRLYEKVVTEAGVKPSDISFVEAHGTGTPVGDPIEFESIRKVFGGPNRTDSLHVASVKGNIGHLEGASGVAALIKTVLMLDRGSIPVQANYKSLNPKIAPLEQDQVSIPLSTQSWNAQNKVACLNNYGAAGSNAAMIVCQAPVSSLGPQTKQPSRLKKYPFYVSANSVASLEAYCQSLEAAIAKLYAQQSSEAFLCSLTYNLSHKQNRSLPYVVTGSVETLSELKLQLASERKNLNAVRQPQPRPVVLAFGGQSKTFVGLDRNIYEASDLFRSYLEQCDYLLSNHGVASIFPAIFQTEPIQDIVLLHSMFFAVQYASAMSWIDCGLRVDAMIGHSFGQLTALSLSGVLSLEDCVRLIVSRARLIETFWGLERGSMISIQADLSVVNALIALDNTDPKPEIACYNGKESYVVVGTSSAIDEMQKNLRDPLNSFASVKSKRLDVSHGFHSRFTDDLLPSLFIVANELTYNKPRISLETCTSTTSRESFEASDIVEHTRSPVYFAEAVTRLTARLGPCTWIEAGSDSSVTSMARLAIGPSASEHFFQPVKLSTNPGPSGISEAVCSLWKEGHQVHFWPFHYRQKDDYINLDLPPYQFEKNLHWLDWHDTIDQPTQRSTSIAPQTNKEPVLLSLTRYLGQSRQSAEFEVDTRSHEYRHLVEGHAVVAQPLCPAPLYVDLASQSALMLRGTSKGTATIANIEKLEIQAPLGAKETIISLVLESMTNIANSWRFNFTTEGVDSNHTAKTHASGTVTLIHDTDSILSELGRFERLFGHRHLLNLLSDTDAEILQGNSIYKLFSKVVTYADYYKGVKNVRAKNHEILGTVIQPSSNSDPQTNSSMNPVVVDNFIQVAGLHVNCLNEIADNEVFVCTKVDRIQPSPDFSITSSSGQSWSVYSNYHHIGEKEVINDIFVFDTQSQRLVFVVLGAHFVRVSITSLERALLRANLDASARHQAITSTNPNFKKIEQEESTTKIQKMNAEIPFLPVNRQADNSWKLKELLHAVTEVPIEDLADEANLLDLGVDSLMITEVLTEINKAFSTSIDMDSFATMTDIASVVKALNTPSTRAESEYSEDSDRSSMSGEGRITRSGTPLTINESPPPLDDLVSRLHALIQSHLETNEPIIGETNLAEYGLDSLLCMELATDISKIFEVDVDMAQLTMESTFGDLTDLVMSGLGISQKLPAALGSTNATQSTTRTEAAASSLATVTSSALKHAQGAFEETRFDYDIYTQETGFNRFWKDVYPTQAKLVLAYTVEAFAQLGCDLSSLRPGERLPSIYYKPCHEKLVKQLYNILRDGLLVATAGSYLVRSDHAISNKSSAVILQQLLAKAPQHASEHRLLNITGSRLGDCLQGTADPLSLLFRSKENKAILEDVYANGPMYKAISRQLVEFFGRAFNGTNKLCPVNILELGGGTGGTTKYIIEFLVRQGIPFTYTFTDISGSLVAAARKRFAGIDSMKFQVLDIEKAPADQLHGRFHAIISTNCIHATRNLEVSTRNIRKMLCSGGFVTLVEFTRNIYWFDLVFGLLEGWWLFEDGRQHVLADQWFWEASMRKSGFQHVTWSDGSSEEAKTLRIITGFNAKAEHDTYTPQRSFSIATASTETVLYKSSGQTPLFADIYYPTEITDTPRPIALMIHGGGHVMLSRKDIRPKQTAHLQSLGFLPISIDYRLCPEVTLFDGPMTDAVDALEWIHSKLSNIPLICANLILDTSRVAVIGWSTGGHLAMTTAFTSVSRGIKEPVVILAFYCPTDYEDPFWQDPNYPEESASLAIVQGDGYDPCESVQPNPITAYNVPPSAKATVGGWYAPTDARSRLVLHMNWRGQCLPVLLNGLPHSSAGKSVAVDQPQPGKQLIQAVSPFAQIQKGTYRVPTCIVHGDDDDLIPWQQSVRVGDALKAHGVRSQVQILKGKKHLFDIYSDNDGSSFYEVQRAYQFLVAEIFGP